MRFQRLHIPAFGPFTDLDMEFSREGTDFHVIFGLNEAGKSSLLRAFRDLLFGIHGQSSDNFLHDYKNLRIKGEIVGRNGEKLAFQRRKGNKNTLLDAADNPLPDNALSPFLGSVDQSYFSTMFGLGARELRQGAEQLLRGEGELGSALFSASMGGTPVQLALDGLRQEAEQLYKGRAIANVSIRPAAKEYKELLRKSRDASVSPDVWEKIEQELASAGKSMAELRESIFECERELEWITRCADALPTVGRLDEEMRKLNALPPMPDVSSDFVQRARAARKAMDDGNAEAQRLTHQVNKLLAQLESCRISPTMQAEAPALERLYRGLGAHLDRQNNRTSLESELAGLEGILRTGMENLEITGDMAQLEKLRLTSALRLACEEAVGELQKAIEEEKTHREKLDDLEAQIGKREAQLKTLPETDLTPIRDALATAAGATDAFKTLEASASEVQRLTIEAHDLHRELPGAPDDWDKTTGLPIPPRSTIRHFGGKMDGIDREITTEGLKILEGRKQIGIIQAELARIERRGELPSEEALGKAREYRNHGWALVLAEWKGEGAREEFMPGMPLEKAFPWAIARADHIADRLREEAEAVAQAEEKRFQIAACEKQNREAGETIRELQEKLRACRTSWEETWQPCGITPQAPGKMEEWRELWGEFRGAIRQLRAAEEAREKKLGRVERATKELAAVLPESEGKGFELLFEKARQRVQRGEESTGRRIEITEQLQGLKAQLSTFRQADERVKKSSKTALDKWKASCRAASLPENTSPASGLALLSERTETVAKFDTWKKMSTQLHKTISTLRQYEQAVDAQCKAFEVSGDTTEARVSRLWEKLAKYRKEQARHEQLMEQLQEASTNLTGIREANAHAVETLSTLTRQAKLDLIENLEPLLANLELRDSAQKQAATFRETLIGLARGQTVDAFLDRIRAEDVDAFPQRKSTLQGRKQEKETALKELQDKWYALSGRKQALDAGGDAAAGHRQMAELCAARLQEDASRYVHLRLAMHFLESRIERFRKENQGPLLEKSGRVFDRITQGAFLGLGAEFNADDTPVLVGLRSDKSTVPIEGMSDGTRDQLYLALRLAALDRYLEQHESMPLILDDLLITFDDRRAGAILKQLTELARRTQIFLFTHHRHLLELCDTTLDRDSFHIHFLGREN